jgi:hypothetical protein
MLQGREGALDALTGAYGVEQMRRQRSQEKAT